jgi:hypothetical protein
MLVGLLFWEGFAVGEGLGVGWRAPVAVGKGLRLGVKLGLSKRKSSQAG